MRSHTNPAAPAPLGAQVAELRQRIEADQRLLIQFGEEKVQLAVQGYDLLEAHYNQLNADIADFTQELQAGGRAGGRAGRGAVGQGAGAWVSTGWAGEFDRCVEKRVREQEKGGVLCRALGRSWRSSAASSSACG